MESIERVTAAVLDRAVRGDPLSPAALTLLIRRYRDTGQADVSDLLGHALAVGLDRHGDEPSTSRRAAWLRAFTEALTVSEDERLLSAARTLIAELANEWPSLTHVRDASPSIDACLAASQLVDPQQLVPRAVDELERIVSAVYHPGERIGDATDHVLLASALLTAFEITGRLPYSMLAEELVQTSRDELFAADVETRCAAVRVLARLAALHDDATYRSAAVIKGEADYRADAARLLADLFAAVDAAGDDVALYGLALDEFGRLA